MHVLVLGAFARSLINFRGPLIEDIIAAGHRVSVGAPDITHDLRTRLEQLGAVVHETPLTRAGTGIRADLRYLRCLRHLMRRIRPDLVLTYTIKPNIWGALAAHARGVPSVAMVTGLGYAFTDTGERPGLKKRLMQFMVRRLYRAATNRNRRVLFQNPDDLDDFVAAGCLADRSKAAMMNGSGVDTARFTPAPLPDAPVVLMIARLLVSKGVRDYAAAALALRQSHPDARFMLLGPRDHSPDAVPPEELDGWIARGLDYRGETGDVRPFIAEARICVLPSFYREGLPRTLLEAMAMGRPIITTDAPGCREAVAHGTNGLLVPVRDPAALAQAIARLLDAPDDAARMGRAGRAMVEQRFDVRLVNRQVMNAMGLLAETAPTPTPGAVTDTPLQEQQADA